MLRRAGELFAVGCEGAGVCVIGATIGVTGLEGASAGGTLGALLPLLGGLLVAGVLTGLFAGALTPGRLFAGGVLEDGFSAG